MKKLKANWAPFPIEYSSCSSLKPNDFQWSSSEGIANVWIDNNIMNHKGGAKGNFGWFCESSEILPDLKSFLLNNSHVLKTRFQNIFTCDKQIIDVNPNFFIFNPPGSNLPWTKKEHYKLHEKKKLCSMVCSPKNMTSGHKLRLQVADQLKGMIDLFGGAHGSPKSGSGIGPSGDWWRSRDESLAPYMFSIVFENSTYENYYTEKITDCFANGTIPIYWGSPKIRDTFDSNGIINWTPQFNINSLTEDIYLSKIDSVKRNLEIVKNLPFSDDILFNKIKELI